jgi:hypothetical protein
MWLLAITLMFLAPVILVYMFAARAQAQATRAGENSGIVGLAIRTWAYQQVVPLVALLAVLFWVTLFLWMGGDLGSGRVQPEPPYPRPNPPPGYQWGPNDSLRPVEKAQIVPSRAASRPAGRAANGPLDDMIGGLSGVSRRPNDYPALPMKSPPASPGRPTSTGN